MVNDGSMELRHRSPDGSSEPRSLVKTCLHNFGGGPFPRQAAGESRTPAEASVFTRHAAARGLLDRSTMTRSRRHTGMRRVWLAIGVSLALANTMDAQAPAPAPPELVETLPASQSVVFTYMNRPITTLRARVLTATPADRAGNATAILDRLVDNDKIGPVSAPSVNGVLFLRVGTSDVLHLASADLNQQAGETLEQRGADARARLTVALDEARELRRGNRLLTGSLRAAAVTLLFVGGDCRAGPREPSCREPCVLGCGTESGPGGRGRW